MLLNPRVSPQASPCLIHKQHLTVGVTLLYIPPSWRLLVFLCWLLLFPLFSQVFYLHWGVTFPATPCSLAPSFHRCYPSKSLEQLAVLASASQENRLITLAQATASSSWQQWRLPAGLLASNIASPFPLQSVLGEARGSFQNKSHHGSPLLKILWWYFMTLREESKVFTKDLP